MGVDSMNELSSTVVHLFNAQPTNVVEAVYSWGSEFSVRDGEEMH